MRKGSPNAQEVYLSVGIALSWWEASEDILMGVFSRLCRESEPVAFDTYVAANRSTRTKMLLNALTRQEARFLEDELKVIRAAMKALDKLAPLRNEIAHGHVSNVNFSEEGVVVMQGNFLLPSLNEAGWHVREPRYAHTSTAIDEWRDKVRAQRGQIMDADMASRMREQQANMAMSPKARDAKMWAEAITKGRVSPEEVAFTHDPAPPSD